MFTSFGWRVRMTRGSRPLVDKNHLQMKRRVQAGILILAFVTVMTGFWKAMGEHAHYAEARAPWPYARGVEEPIEARVLFLKNCARCHGDDGRSRTKLGESLGATDLSNTKWQKHTSNKRVLRSIAEGRQKVMPAFANKLSADEISELAAYVRTLRQAQRH